MPEIIQNIFYKIDAWTIFGFLAHFVFFMRFFVQWLYSEKLKKSVLPESFWYISVAGSIMILAYAFHIKDPVFVFGHLAALFIYIRNIFLFQNNKHENTNKIHNK